MREPSVLTIANLVANYFVPQGIPDPTVLRARLDRLVQLAQGLRGFAQSSPG
jgi:hypothetical protein